MCALIIYMIIMVTESHPFFIFVEKNKKSAKFETCFLKYFFVNFYFPKIQIF